MMEYISQLFAGATAIFISIVTWALRAVLTNKEEVRLLKEEIKFREENRKEQDNLIRASLETLSQKVETVQRDILDLYKNQK